jgi:hypothetical protein
LRGSDPRRLAATFFLNVKWDATKDGGCNRMCFADRPRAAAPDKTIDVSPAAGCLLLWLPHRVALEVLPVKRSYWALTTYFNT